MLFLLDLPSTDAPTSSTGIDWLWREVTGTSGRWTVRVCWPASVCFHKAHHQDCRAHLQIYLQRPAQVALQALRDAPGGSLYLRATVVPSGVYAQKPHQENNGPEPIPFTVLLERVYLFFIPETSLSLLRFLAVLVSALLYFRVPKRVAAYIGLDAQPVAKSKAQ